MPIRPAQTQDIPAIQALLAQILQIHHDIRPDIFQERGGKYTSESLQTLFADPHQPVFVYTDAEDKILGHLFLQIKQEHNPVKLPIKSLYIDDLCVSEEARGLGIGRKLYEYAKTLAKLQGCYNLTLNVWNANQAAVAFYDNLGFKPQQTQLEQILGDA